MITRRTALASCAAVGVAAVTAGLARAEPGGPAAMRWDAEQAPFQLAQARRTAPPAGPTIIADPVLGLVNLAGPAGQALLEKDRAALADVFQNNIRIGDTEVPPCNVLFFYGTLEPSTRVAGQKFTLRDMIKAARARIAVLATDLPPDLMKNDDFDKAMQAPSDWPANIVLVLDRQGDDFGRFFARLFSSMREGLAMPSAWVKIAPQGPYQPKDIPSAVAIFEAGNIAFGPRKKG
jgi:hypothetical protein